MESQQQSSSFRGHFTESDYLTGEVPNGGARKYSDVSFESNPTTPVRRGVRSYNRNDSMFNGFDRSMIYSDEAEDAVLSSVEKRAKNTEVGEDGFRPSVEGERPPLRVQNLGVIQKSFSGSSRRSSSRRGSSRRDSIQFAMHRRGKELAALRQKTVSNALHKGHHRTHRISQTLLMDNLQQNLIADLREATEFFHQNDPIGFKDAFEDKENDSDDVGSTDQGSAQDMEDDDYSGERLPLLNGSSSMEQKLKARRLLKKNQWKFFKKILKPGVILQCLYDWLVHSTLIVAIPLFILALVLFYLCGNPLTPRYIPGGVSCAWWFNFVGRQLLTLELAKLSQRIVIDGLILTKRAVINALGPWLTIFFIQSKGRPFVLCAWGFWDLVLLEGNGKFKQHWFYFTGLKIYSTGNSGSFILASDYYLRILFCMILTGIALSLKATFIALYFGRQMVATYKPKLQEIIDDVVTITEVSELSAIAADIASEVGTEEEYTGSVVEVPVEKNDSSIAKMAYRSAIRWSDIRFQNNDLNDSESEADEQSSLDESRSVEGGLKKIDFEFDSEGGKFFSNSKKETTTSGTISTRSRLAIKSSLDKWDEPIVKGGKSRSLSIADIMNFRQALKYMDLDYPFSEAFGVASTRNQMITSAEAVYKGLTRLSTNSNNLNFSAFEFLLFGDDGNEDEKKKKRLMNMFHPEPNGDIPLLAFVQACDTLYRKLRLFRASVGNSSVIDTVLESIIDPIFFFCLITVLMAILKLNPMTMLVPMSSLLLAGSFAFGSTCAKAFEGIILIVGRRPYGIGDRIVIQDSAGATVPETRMSWIVEDISLLSTTLRYGSTNEIAQVSNGSIASARITNCNRSEKAIVSVLLNFHMSCHDDTRTMDAFREGVEQYIREDRNTWDSIFFFRCESVEPSNEKVVYRLAVRSIHNWQVSNRVYMHRGELFQFCVSLSYKLKIHYDGTNVRRILYYGGSLDNGGVKDYKTHLLNNSNIKNKDEDFFRQVIGHWNEPATDSHKESSEFFRDKLCDSPIRPKSLASSVNSKGGDSPMFPKKTLDHDDKAFLSMLQDSHDPNVVTGQDDDSPMFPKKTWDHDDRAFLSMLQDSNG
eukprot:CAMPEP_0172391710 /NCGR_PEP_ID=MMETSP1061-20121228/8053_1 /TAXON_ID=37318 /ORGANISM="Pseudo-nitzschia pungens, Strain cf. pungens" /LENGTH=1098 /DNA_ID=CAMNT_0013122399 /DNA_START=125 /DNA_END=3421 /DNA_ORIENTATION=-